MDHESLQGQVREKERYAKLDKFAAEQAGSTRSLGLNNVEEASEPSLTERIIAQRKRSQEQVYKGYKYERLLHLIDKNPEVIEILELLKNLHMI